MGLFGTPPRQETVAPPAFEEVEVFVVLPPLPKAQSTIIAQGITVTGVIRGEGTVLVEGRLEGEIDMKGGVTVAASGMVQGPITADAVRVAGDVQGNITAREHLCLERTGGIHGDVATASLIVENGRLEGSSSMLNPPPQAQPREPDISVQDLQFGAGYDLELDEK